MHCTELYLVGDVCGIYSIILYNYVELLMPEVFIYLYEYPKQIHNLILVRGGGGRSWIMHLSQRNAIMI